MKLFITCIFISLLSACAASYHHDMDNSNIKTSDNGKIVTIDPSQSAEFQPIAQHSAPSDVASRMISPILK